MGRASTRRFATHADQSSEASSHALLAFAVAIGLCLSPRPSAAQLTPGGPDFDIGTSHQFRGIPIAGASDGGFTVVDANELGVFARRFNEVGVPLGADIQIDTDGGDSASVAFSTDGRFLVTWVGPNGIRAQLVETDSSFVGSEISVSGDGAAPSPVSSFLSSGGFVVVWNDGSSIQGRVFDDAGVAVTDAVTLPTDAGPHAVPDVAGLSAGGFVATWDSRGGQDGSEWGIFANRFDDIGSALGTEFQVNSYTSGRQGYPHITAAPTGEFALVWQSYGQSQQWDTFGQLFSFDATPIGAEFMVNTSTSGWQIGPHVAATDDARFVVVWHDFTNVFARVIDSDGVPLDDELEITTVPNSGDYLDPFIAKTGPKNFVAKWYQGETLGRRLRIGTPVTTTTTTTTLPQPCDAIPETGCLTAPRSQLRIVKGKSADKDKIAWKWRKGAAFDADKLGRVGATTYALCLYDSSSGLFNLATSLIVEPNESWLYHGDAGWTYSDSSGNEDGVRHIKLKTGDQGRSLVQLNAKGLAVPMPTPLDESAYFDQGPTVRVQLVAYNSDQTVTCWKSDFIPVGTAQNNADRFVARWP